MMASDMVDKLQKLIDEHGDLPLASGGSMDGLPIEPRDPEVHTAGYFERGIPSVEHGKQFIEI